MHTQSAVVFDNGSDAREVDFIIDMQDLLAKIIDAKARFAFHESELLRNELSDKLPALAAFFDTLAEQVK